MKKGILCVLVGFIISLAYLLSMNGFAVSGQEGAPKEGKMGCYPNGELFDGFYPDAIPLRTIPYLTEFGTLNANVVVGQKPTGIVTAGAMELCERIGEYLQVINTSSSDAIALVATDVPQKYLLEKTMILCGGPDENALVKKLVQEGKSRVDWSTAEHGKIEVIPGAFGGSGAAVILAGRDPEGSVFAISAMSQFFKHLIGAGLVEAMMLQADRQLQRGDTKGAADSCARLVDGLRIDGSANFYVPIKDNTPDFPKLLKEEVEMSRQFARFLLTNPTPEKANAQFREIAGKCAYCHQRYLSYDRMTPNRVKYLYSQYPGARLESDWARKQ